MKFALSFNFDHFPIQFRSDQKRFPEIEQLTFFICLSYGTLNIWKFKIVFTSQLWLSVTLLHPEETFPIPVLQATTKCNFFQNNPILLVSPSRVQSPVSLSIFREFISELKGKPISISGTNLTELKMRCQIPIPISSKSYADRFVLKKKWQSLINSWFTEISDQLLHLFKKKKIVQISIV
jgi:hypothetical protein